MVTRCATTLSRTGETGARNGDGDPVRIADAPDLVGRLAAQVENDAGVIGSGPVQALAESIDPVGRHINVAVTDDAFSEFFEIALFQLKIGKVANDGRVAEAAFSVHFLAAFGRQAVAKFAKSDSRELFHANDADHRDFLFIGSRKALNDQASAIEFGQIVCVDRRFFRKVRPKFRLGNLCRGRHRRQRYNYRDDA